VFAERVRHSFRKRFVFVLSFWCLTFCKSLKYHGGVIPAGIAKFLLAITHHHSSSLAIDGRNLCIAGVSCIVMARECSPLIARARSENLTRRLSQG
jgi:hypothetical protein